jgi:predicted PurR-regulated permease PerM
MAENDETDETPDEIQEERRWHRYTKYLYLLARFAYWAGILALLYVFLNAIGSVLFPVFLSLIIAYLFDPLIDWFEERGVVRSAGIVVVITCALGLGVVFALFLYPTIVQQVRRVGEQFPQALDLIEYRLIPWVERTFDYEVPATVAEAIDKYGDSLRDSLPGLVNQMTTWATDILTGTGAIVIGLVNTIMIPIFSFYFLRDFDDMKEKLVEYIPPHRRDFVLDRVGKMDTVVGDWVRGQLQVAATLAVMYAIGLGVVFAWIGIDAKSGIAIGLLGGMLNFIPYFGVAIGIVLAVLMVVINWPGFLGLLAVGMVFFVVQMLEGYYITPKIVGEKVGLQPVTVIIVLLIGAELFGLLGMLLAIPVFGALKVLFPDIVAYYKRTAYYSGVDPVTNEPKPEWSVEVDDPEMPGERPGDDGEEEDPKNGWAKALGEEESDGEIDTDGVPDPDAPADDE